MEQEKYAIEELARWLGMKIGRERINIKGYRDKLDSDFLYYFKWTGEDLFKSHFMARSYEQLKDFVGRAKDATEVHDFIRKKREECLKELVDGSIRKMSTNDLFNLTHTLKLECAQQLIKEYMEFDNILSIEPPQKQVTQKPEASDRKKSNGLKM